MDGRDLIGLAVGGPSSGVFPPSMLDTPIAPGQLHEAGVMLGAGGVIVLDDRTTIPTVVRSLAAYNADESCGKCTPCREGTPRMVDALDRLIGGKGSIRMTLTSCCSWPMSSERRRCVDSDRPQADRLRAPSISSKQEMLALAE